jgi:hypothetical protein
MKMVWQFYTVHTHVVSCATSCTKTTNTNPTHNITHQSPMATLFEGCAVTQLYIDRLDDITVCATVVEIKTVTTIVTMAQAVEQLESACTYNSDHSTMFFHSHLGTELFMATCTHDTCNSPFGSHKHPKLFVCCAQQHNYLCHNGPLLKIQIGPIQEHH